ncbi:MAG: hypothetical protein NTZ20_05070 [Candidatus Levybacteria bacterium]|nr:hypothetical protein [Candidatus Levybacteria bacterium]
MGNLKELLIESMNIASSSIIKSPYSLSVLNNVDDIITGQVDFSSSITENRIGDVIGVKLYNERVRR